MGAGEISISGSMPENSLRSLADFYDDHDINIAAIADAEAVIPTLYTGEYGKAFVNIGAVDGVVKYKTNKDKTTIKTYPLMANGGNTLKLPAVYSIVKSGTTVTDVKVLTQKIDSKLL